MILDEVLGNLDYAARQSGLLEAGPAVTAHIEVEFRQVSCFEGCSSCTLALQP